MTATVESFFTLRSQLEMITDETSLATWADRVKNAVDTQKISGTERATLAALYKLSRDRIQMRTGR